MKLNPGFAAISILMGMLGLAACGQNSNQAVYQYPETAVLFDNFHILKTVYTSGEMKLLREKLDYLYALADRHYEAAEKIEIRAVSVHSSCMDHSSSYSFTIEKEGEDWFFSFDAALNLDGAHMEVENQRIGESDAEEILRIIKEKQLVTRVKEYKEPPDNDILALDENTYRTSFEFTDGSSIYAPIDAGNELIDAFYRLAGVGIYQR